MRFYRISYERNRKGEGERERKRDKKEKGKKREKTEKEVPQAPYFKGSLRNRC